MHIKSIEAPATLPPLFKAINEESVLECNQQINNQEGYIDVTLVAEESPAMETIRNSMPCIKNDSGIEVLQFSTKNDMEYSSNIPKEIWFPDLIPPIRWTAIQIPNLPK